MGNKIVLVGASSTGKTTVYNLLKQELPKYRFINESTREILKYGYQINENGDDLTQLAISNFHLQSLLACQNPLHNQNLVLDRCYLDLFVYSQHLNQVSQRTLNFITDVWEEVKYMYTHYVYFPIEFNPVDDGVRSINTSWRSQIDTSFKQVLSNNNDLNILTVQGSPRQRVESILKFIS